MRLTLRRLLPSMFYRRLLLLSAAAIFVTMALGLQMTRLTVAQGAERRGQVEAALLSTRLIPTVRGRILDRWGRVLAEDKLSHDVTVSYSVITGQWVYTQARAKAYGQNRSRWPELSNYGRELLIGEYVPEFEDQVEQMWHVLAELGGVTVEELDDRRKSVIAWVQKQASSVHWRWRLERQEQVHEPITLAAVAQPIREQKIKHPVLTNVDSDTQVRVQSFVAEAQNEPALAVWKQVRVVASKQRRYPNERWTLVIDRSHLPGPLKTDQPIEVTVDGVGLHVVGAMRRIWQEDIQGPDGRPYRTQTPQGQPIIDPGGYRPGDRTGQWGIERAMEDWLRGLRGREVTHLDTGEKDRTEPVRGHDTRLSIDIQLQARIQAIMDPHNAQIGLMQRQPWHAQELSGPIGEPLNGAAVVLDIAQGQVLAAVSVPTFSRQQLQDDPDSVWADRLNQPYINRSVAMPYQPGSTVKPLVLAATITDRKLGYDEQVTCTGHLYPDKPDVYRCWIYKLYNGRTHGSLGGTEAIAHSCNIFFYTMGRRLGARRLAEWYWDYGLGHRTGCGLQEEITGELPDLSQAHPNAPGFTLADGIFMGIGQGQVRWTPIQAAAAYATLARGGYVLGPTFVMGADPNPQQTSRDLRLDPRAVEMAMQGLDDAVNQSYGTANHIRFSDAHRENILNITGVVPGLRVYGKSGTATAVPLRLDSDGDGRITGRDEKVRQGDHAWFIAFVQRPGSPRPDFVIAVVAEYAGSGGRVAGPIANQIMHALRAEGYL